MGRETGFLEYNVDNMMQNLLQAEDHLRVLYGKSSNNAGHNSCVVKHLFIVSGEAGEAVSHSTVVEPSKTPAFREIKDDADNLRKGLNALDVSEAIERTREIRKKVEKLDPNIDTERCEACSRTPFSSEKGKALNTEGHQDIIMKFGEGTKQVLTINGGQIVGRAVTDLGGPQLDAAVTPGAQLPYRASTWMNIIGGIGIQLLAMKYVKNPQLKLGAIVVGSHMLSKTVDYAVELGTGTVTRKSVYMVSSTPSVVGNGSVPSF